MHHTTRLGKKLSTFLQKFPSGLPSINLQTVYGPEYQTQLQNLYLYFVKLFGCYIVNSGVAIDTGDFSKSLLERCDLSDFYIRCSYFPNWPVEKTIALTEMEVANDQYGPCDLPPASHLRAVSLVTPVIPSARKLN